MNLFFILDERGEPRAEPDFDRWAEWVRKYDLTRVVAREVVGGCKVSTVFLTLAGFSASGSPYLWESMVFGGELDLVADRCRGSREQAEAMHTAMVARVRAAELSGRRRIHE